MYRSVNKHAETTNICMWIHTVCNCLCPIRLIGLSIERPILDHHPKAHVHEIRRISYGFHEIRRISYGFHTDFIRISPWNPADFTLKSGRFHEIREIRQISPRYHLWNPKIIKASVSAKTLQFDECRVGAMTKDFMKSTRFHPEIWWISPMKSGRFHPDFTCEIHPNYKSKCFSKNSSVWWMQGGGFHPWNPVDFILKSGGFHPWNLADFYPDLTCEIHPNYKSKCFSKNSSVWWMQGGGFHPGNPVDFTLQSGGFHPWNLADFTQISPVKSTQNYKSKCFSKNSSVWRMQGGGFHPWNPVDFTLNSGGFHPWNLQISPRFDLWNPPKIIKASVLAKTLQFDECRVGAMTKDFMKLPDLTLKSGGFHQWNLVDFTQISPVKSTQIIKASVSAKTLQFDECRVGAMTKDFMKSARFHLKSTGFHEICWISYGFHEIWWISWNPWNLADFTMKSGGFQVKSDVSEISCRCFSKNSSDFTRFGVDFTWNLLDFMKSTRFHLKSTGFHEIC